MIKETTSSRSTSNFKLLIFIGVLCLAASVVFLQFQPDPSFPSDPTVS